MNRVCSIHIVYSGPSEARKGWGGHQSDNKGRAKVFLHEAQKIRAHFGLMYICVYMKYVYQSHISLAFKSGVAQAAPATPLPTALILCTVHTFFLIAQLTTCHVGIMGAK